MENSIIKELLSYSLGADLHEKMRDTLKREDGSYESKIKTTKDIVWTMKHNTDVVDIANCHFYELPEDWQSENLEAARVVINLVFNRIVDNIEFTPEEIEIMSSVVHNNWLKRHKEVYDFELGNPLQAIPYSDLSEEEKAKFLGGLSNEERNSILKQLSTDAKLDILENFIDAGNSMGLNFQIEDINNDTLSMSIRNENGDLIDVSGVGSTVEDTGYDYRLFAVIAGVILSASLLGIYVVFRSIKKEAAEEK